MLNDGGKMEDFSSRQEPERKQPRGFLTSLHGFGSTLHWLESFIQLTEAEQEEAGIYLGDQRDSHLWSED